MKPHRFGHARARRTAARLLAGVLLASAVSATSTAPAHAATKVLTRYAFNTAAWGTRAAVQPVGATSGDTALSMIDCTRIAGITHDNNVAGATFPGLTLGALVSTSDTFKDAAGNVGSESTSRIASITLGSGATALVIHGLEGTSRAWHRSQGGFNAVNHFSFGSATLGPVPLPSGAFAGQGVTVPGFGRVALGDNSKVIGTRQASARAASLRIQLFGPDSTPGTSDDTVVFVGSTVAQVQKGATQGVMKGEAYGLHITALGGAVTSKKNVLLPLGCTGTGGKTITTSLATLSPDPQLVVSGLFSKVYGIQNHPIGGLKAVTQSGVASVNLGGGQLIIKGVLGKVKVVRDRFNHIHRVPTQSVGSITAGGTTYPAPPLGQSLTIPGVASITSPTPVATKHGMKVVALRVQFLPGTPGETDIDLGTATAAVRRK